MLAARRPIFLKEKRKKESSYLVGGGWLSSFFEKIQPGFKLAVGSGSFQYFIEQLLFTKFEGGDFFKNPKGLNFIAKRVG